MQTTRLEEKRKQITFFLFKLTHENPREANDGNANDKHEDEDKDHLVKLMVNGGNIDDDDEMDGEDGDQNDHHGPWGEKVRDGACFSEFDKSTNLKKGRTRRWRWGWLSGNKRNCQRTKKSVSTIAIDTIKDQDKERKVTSPIERQEAAQAGM